MQYTPEAPEVSDPFFSTCSVAIVGLLCVAITNLISSLLMNL